MNLRQRTKASGEPSPDQIPSSSWWDAAVFLSHPGLRHLAVLLVNTLFFAFLEKLDPPSGSITCMASTYSVDNHQPH